MNYFKNTKNEIFAYDDEQVKQGYGKNLEKLEKGEFYDSISKSIKPYKLEGFIEVKRDENNSIISPQELIDELNKQKLLKKTIKWKKERQTKVDNIEVTYNNIVYQGDEISQTRMARAIMALPDDTTTINWVAKDNSVQKLTRVDLKAILLDAGSQQTQIWNKGRPQ